MKTFFSGLHRFLVQKTRFCGREDLFFIFGLHQFLVKKKQDSVDVKAFFFVFTDFQWKKLDSVAGP